MPAKLEKLYTKPIKITCHLLYSALDVEKTKVNKKLERTSAKWHHILGTIHGIEGLLPIQG